MEHVDLDHALQVAIGAGGARHLVLRIRPARPVRQLVEHVDLDHALQVAIGAAAPGTWSCGSVRRDR
ncbi:hypothetical protein [Pseudomonas aeruginosa]|uniref:hypothetical protein n=1 Tax=Pseudomonas aeruginosa TaxID=287 RepID=UPI0024BF2048|nr:hypothetical protein [Pseudomonas aeruginosa]WHV74276.1 hypothetical protein M2I95_32310 [Pseudomonas aeruginosa]